MGTESVGAEVHGQIECSWLSVGMSLSCLVAVDTTVDVASFPLSIYLPESSPPTNPFLFLSYPPLLLPPSLPKSRHGQPGTHTLPRIPDHTHENPSA